jgi:molybdenum cofactor biosynthesis protein B
MSHVEHQKAAEEITVGFAVLTLSDTRTRDTDTSGRLIRETLTAQRHQLVAEEIIRDEPVELNRVLDAWLNDARIDAIITNGGTGLSRRDQTIDAIESRLERTIPGFGELFRMLSYKEIGAAAMLSRATAGVAMGKLIVALPGSTNAVRLALDELVSGQLRHIVRELRK